MRETIDGARDSGLGDPLGPAVREAAPSTPVREMQAPRRVVPRLSWHGARFGSSVPDPGSRIPGPGRRGPPGTSGPPPMRVAVVTSSPPMTEGGHMVIARALVHALRAEGHHADIIVTPQNRFGRQAAAYLATWLTDVGMSDGQPIDQVISLRYPSYAVRHPHHVCWLNHTMREYYDLWPRFTRGLGRLGLAKERVRRRLTHAADRYLLTRNVRRLFVQSRTVQERLAMWPELRSTVLYPPPPQRAYRCDGYGDYVFMVSRLTPLKRADLLRPRAGDADGAGIRAVIAGDGEERGRLDALAAQLGLASRVTFTGALPEPELLEHLARCRAVCFPPVSEDYGFVTVEAFASRQAGRSPARTAAGRPSSSSTASAVSSASPTPEALAGALRRCMDDPRRERSAWGGRAPRLRGNADLAGDGAAVDGGRLSLGGRCRVPESWPTPRPLETRIAKKVTKAITDYGLIEDGDRVMVGLSGGKDSWALFQILDVLRKRAPISFSLIGVTVDSGYDGFRHDLITEHLRAARLGIPHRPHRDRRGDGRPARRPGDAVLAVRAAPARRAVPAGRRGRRDEDRARPSPRRLHRDAAAESVLRRRAEGDAGEARLRQRPRTW